MILIDSTQIQNDSAPQAWWLLLGGITTLATVVVFLYRENKRIQKEKDSHQERFTEYVEKNTEKLSNVVASNTEAFNKTSQSLDKNTDVITKFIEDAAHKKKV